MVSKHNVREIDPWCEEGKETIKERVECHFDYSIWNFISELESLLEFLSQVNQCCLAQGISKHNSTLI